MFSLVPVTTGEHTEEEDLPAGRQEIRPLEPDYSGFGRQLRGGVPCPLTPAYRQAGLSTRYEKRCFLFIEV
ncbi:MAG: hypothetical protein A3D47_00900 [Candidatus Colwellbacteria bacterium RIFCSPHIGHO2_02_FULL_43_15]|uniref:Uncharacterized protein n=1 Tax=Candidatus Colwellbacteria bacterium RIFCSPHIGHO2_02_FULL_43_15 TaxID=1797686 RepID=A0A1G1YY23_9BACT|nr:MAG: hypothetical protein A3D47_00900 [Candidatus Colwellbacteria bacterium RIFCSPHIGHO2_02_FULL_43_15]